MLQFHNKKIHLILIFCFFQCCFSQSKTEVQELFAQGESAFKDKDFIKAKEYFQLAIQKDSLKKDIWFNLGASQFSLDEFDSSCESFYRAYKLGDNEAFEYLKKYCTEFSDRKLTSINFVDDPIKFKYKNKIYSLFENKNLNQKYIELVKLKIYDALNDLKYDVKGKMIAYISVDKNGLFNGRVAIINSNMDDNVRKDLNKKLTSFIATMVEYIPAIYKGSNVETWERWTLPINF